MHNFKNLLIKKMLFLHKKIHKISDSLNSVKLPLGMNAWNLMNEWLN